MPEVAGFKIEKQNEILIIGKSAKIEYSRLADDSITQFWHKCFEENIFASLEEIAEQTEENKSYAGYMSNFTGNGFHYTAGLLIDRADAEKYTSGFEQYKITGTECAVAYIKGSESEILGEAHAMTEEQIKKTPYKIKESDYWCMEVYNVKKFTIPDKNGDIIIEYYIPVVKKYI